MSVRHALGLALAVALAWFPSVAGAHQSSTSYSTIRIEDDGRLAYTLALSTRDLYEALGLDADRDATDAEVRSGEERLWGYVLARVALEGEGGRPCELARTGTTLRDEAERRVELRFTARCPTPGAVTLDYRLFFDLDPRHTGWVTISQGATSVQEELKLGASRRVLDVRGGLGAADYVREGLAHIFTGYDHIAFLLGLLLVAAIAWVGGAWHARALGASLRSVAATVTAFTAAHSLTLIAAALGFVRVPSRLVEATIAASIVVVAIENLVRRAPRTRWPLAFGFGLVHGMGFASLLAPILPPKGVVVPLLLFNVGVELGQLAIVLVVVPALLFAARRDPAGYRRVAVLGGSTLVGLLGLIWLIERVLDVSLISRWL